MMAGCEKTNPLGLRNAAGENSNHWRWKWSLSEGKRREEDGSRFLSCLGKKFYREDAEE